MAKLITPAALLSFPHFDKPHRMDEKDKLKYSGMFVWQPGTDLSALQEAIVETAVAQWGQAAIAKLKSGALINPLKDAEKKGFAAGSFYVNARSDRAPGLVYPWPEPGSTKPMKVPAEKVVEVFYPGATVRAQLSPFAYDTKGNKGVSFGLENVQLVDGTTPRFDGRQAPDDAFDATTEMVPANLDDLENQG